MIDPPPGCSSIKEHLEENVAGLIKLNWSWTQTGREHGKVYPKNHVINFWDRSKLDELLFCTCQRRGCCYYVRNAEEGDGKYPFDDLMLKLINEQYSLVLALLVVQNAASLIINAVEKCYSNDRLTKTPLGFSEARDLLECDKSRKRPIKDVVVYDLVQTQNQFFLPVLSHKFGHYTIDSGRLLPFSVEENIGEGSTAAVYRARMFKGYHDFPDVENDMVALKVIKPGIWEIDDEPGDSPNEAELNKFWQAHEYIAPLQVTMQFGRDYILVYPLARCDLEKLLNNPVPEIYQKDPNKAWERFMKLLSALDYIHRRAGENQNSHLAVDGSTYMGYHLDIKPHNILVCENGEWTITDFGQAHSKIRDCAASATARPQLTQRYSSPDKPRHRNSDVFSMGCIGCEILVWLKDGPDGVAAFKERRKFEAEQTTLYSFHDNKELRPAVKELLGIPADKATKSLSTTVEDDSLTIKEIIGRMMEFDTRKRSKSEDAGMQFAKILGKDFNIPLKKQEPLSAQARIRRPSLNINTSTNPSTPEKLVAPDGIVYFNFNGVSLKRTASNPNISPVSPSQRAPPLKMQKLTVPVPEIQISEPDTQKNMST